jgi:insulysin
VTCALLSQILLNPAHHVLRTQEQLGYVVFCSDTHLTGKSHLGIVVTVQSVFGPCYLEERVDKFLESMESHIARMDEAEFQQHKSGLEQGWKEKILDLYSEMCGFWPGISSGYLDFHRRWFFFCMRCAY